MAMTYGAGVPIAMSQKQKLNTCSCTEAELVGVDDVVKLILWTKLFLEAQGCKIEINMVFQDNQSTILLEVNSKRSSSKRTCAFTTVISLSQTKWNLATFLSSIAPLS